MRETLQDLLGQRPIRSYECHGAEVLCLGPISAPSPIPDLGSTILSLNKLCFYHCWCVPEWFFVPDTTDCQAQVGSSWLIHTFNYPDISFIYIFDFIGPGQGRHYTRLCCSLVLNWQEDLDSINALNVTDIWVWARCSPCSLVSHL